MQCGYIAFVLSVVFFALCGAKGLQRSHFDLKSLSQLLRRNHDGQMDEETKRGGVTYASKRTVPSDTYQCYGWTSEDMTAMGTAQVVEQIQRHRCEDELPNMYIYFMDVAEKANFPSCGTCGCCSIPALPNLVQAVANEANEFGTPSYDSAALTTALDNLLELLNYNEVRGLLLELKNMAENLKDSVHVFEFLEEMKGIASDITDAADGFDHQMDTRISMFNGWNGGASNRKRGSAGFLKKDTDTLLDLLLEQKK